MRLCGLNSLVDYLYFSDSFENFNKIQICNKTCVVTQKKRKKRKKKKPFVTLPQT